MTSDNHKEIKTKYMSMRLTPAMMELLKKEAEENTRTVASQVLFILKNHFNSKK